MVRLIFGLLLLLPLGSRGADWASTPPAVPEARVVKAAYVYNFTKFIEWAAEDGVTDRAATVTICVLGSDPVGSALDEIASFESKGRPILVHHVRAGEPIPACHILYIGNSEATRLASILAQLGASGVLTVSDLPRFAEQGGMIGFALDRGRVRVEINALRVRGAGLRISSKLLEVARVVTEARS
jgi:hypothetical protein